ncbi:hypothetical protein A2U01_0049101, partial [Trifolium medium]|nr:hypothetical protein [Trifolium medium]
GWPALRATLLLIALFLFWKLRCTQGGAARSAGLVC